MAQDTPTDNLIAYWSLTTDETDDFGALDMAEVGTVTYDSSGADLSANNYLKIPVASAGALQLGLTSQTWSFWFRYHSAPAADAVPIVQFGWRDQADTVADDGFGILVSSGNQILCRFSDGTTPTQFTLSGTYTTNTWYHCGAIMNRSGTMDVYINGTRQSNTSISVHSAVSLAATVDMLVGGPRTTRWYDGNVRHVAVYTGTGSIALIDRLYGNGTPPTYATLAAETTLGGRTRENFGSLTTGTGTPSGFTALGSTGTTYEIVTNGSSEGGKHLLIDKTATGRARLTFDVTNGKTQQDIVALFEVESGTTNAGVIVNATGAAGAETEYLLYYTNANTTLTLFEAVSGTYTSRASRASALGAALASGTVYAMRLRRQENTYYGRIWIPANEDEPASWDVSSLDGSPRGAGGAGLFCSSDTGGMIVHYISVAIGNDAGCVLPDAGFPDVGIYATSSADGSLRVYDEAAPSTNGVVALFGPDTLADVRACAVHMANETVFVAQRLLGEVTRVDRYGLNATTINSTVANPYGLDVDEVASRLFITDRDAGKCYTDSIAGGSEVDRLTLTTASHVYWDATNSKLWWVGNGIVYSGDNTFGSSTSYLNPPATPLHAISDGTTVSVADFDVAGADGVFTKPVASPTDAYTTADTTAPGLLHAFAINGDRNKAYGTGPDVDVIVKWTVYPPTTASRTTWATLVDGRYVDWFEFAAVDGVSRASDEISAYALGAKTATGIAVAAHELSYSTTGYKTGIGIVTASHEAISFAVYTRASSGVVVVSDEMTGQSVCGTLTRSGQVVAGDEIIGYGVCSTSVVPSVIILSIAHLHKIGLTMAHLNKITLTIYEVD